MYEAVSLVCVYIYIYIQRIGMCVYIYIYICIVFYDGMV